MGEGIGKSFAEALGRKDAGALRRLLAPELDFRAMTPGRFWESTDAADVVDNIMLGKWFEPKDDITEIVAVDCAPIGPRERVGYRFRVKNPDGVFLVEQQAYLQADGDRIHWLRVSCSGF